MFLEQGSENFSFKGPDSKYFSFVDHMVSVVAIQQLLLLEHKSRNRQYVHKLSMTVFHSKFTKIGVGVAQSINGKYYWVQVFSD